MTDTVLLCLSLPSASSANKDMDAHLQTFDSVPLFMKSLPDEGEDQDTAALDALQSLTFDGTPDGGFEKQVVDVEGCFYFFYSGLARSH